jgi:hypothetical protein
MNQHGTNEINRLIGEFMDLQEQWESNPAAFNWSALQALAEDGALAYNEGAGPSFQALALDSVEHGELHERFLAYSMDAGFDPFKLAKTGSGTTVIPVISHSSLAEAAGSNPSSARMRASLMELARARFSPHVQKDGKGAVILPNASLSQIIEACSESIPLDLLEKFTPELAKPHGELSKELLTNPIEGRLSPAELIVDDNVKPYG